MKTVISKILNKLKKDKNIGSPEYLDDIEAFIQINTLVDMYLPQSGSAIRPNLLRKILNDILINGRRNIAECGSGISTIYIASLLKQHSFSDAKIYSIDHDQQWQSIIKDYLTELKLTEFVQLIHAPLETFSNDFKTVDWYQSKSVDKYLENIKIDQLIVDGPPAFKKSIKYSRYPAALYFKDKLNANCSIFLDDTNRKSEALIAKKWESILEMQIYSDKKSFSIGFKGVNYNI
jgi:hypothetical protein